MHYQRQLVVLFLSGALGAEVALAQGAGAVSPVNESQAGRGLGADSPFRRDGLVPGGLNTPRPGVDVFRATPDTWAPSPAVPWLSPSVSGPRWGAPRNLPPRGSSPDGDGRGRRGERRAGGGTAILIPYPVTAGAYANGGLYLSPYYIWPTPAGQAVPTQPPAPAEPVGFLRLMVTPRNASVIVDGIYEGLVDDFGGSSERPLAAGVRHVRLEAEGYEAVEFDVRVPTNDTIILRRDLYVEAPAPRSAPLPSTALSPPLASPAAPASAAVTTSAPAEPQTIYVIPRCYLGNTPPKQAQLPPECRATDVRTVPQ